MIMYKLHKLEVSFCESKSIWGLCCDWSIQHFFLIGKFYVEKVFSNLLQSKKMKTDSPDGKNYVKQNTGCPISSGHMIFQMLLGLLLPCPLHFFMLGVWSLEESGCLRPMTEMPREKKSDISTV